MTTPDPLSKVLSGSVERSSDFTGPLRPLGASVRLKRAGSAEPQPRGLFAPLSQQVVDVRDSILRRLMRQFRRPRPLLRRRCGAGADDLDALRLGGQVESPLI